MNTTPDRRTGHSTGRGLLAVLLVLGLTACAAQSNTGTNVTALRSEVSDLEDRVTALEEETQAAVAPDDPAAGELGDEDVLENPDAYVGEAVTVTAEVHRVIDETAFRIGTPDGSLLVVTASQPPIVEQGERVRVTGTVHDSFDIAEFENENDVDLDEDLLSDLNLEEEPYLAADVIEPPVNAPTEATDNAS